MTTEARRTTARALSEGRVSGQIRRIVGAGTGRVSAIEVVGYAVRTTLGNNTDLTVAVCANTAEVRSSRDKSGLVVRDAECRQSPVFTPIVGLAAPS